MEILKLQNFVSKLFFEITEEKALLHLKEFLNAVFKTGNYPTVGNTLSSCV